MNMYLGIKVTLLGILEGVTEFIPVSSTGHLILFGRFLHLQGIHEATFDIAIQLGAIMAVVVLYREFFFKFFRPRHWLTKEASLVFIAMVPALILGAGLHHFIKERLFIPLSVGCAFLVGGILMIVIEKSVKQHAGTRDMSQMTYAQALKIGMWQCLALWPGFSRSGATIMGGLVSGLDYALAAQFSFIVAVPVMTAAVGFDLIKSVGLLTRTDLIWILWGGVVSFGVAVISIVFFLKLLQRFRLLPFALYRIALAGIIFLIYFWH